MDTQILQKERVCMFVWECAYVLGEIVPPTFVIQL